MEQDLELGNILRIIKRRKLWLILPCICVFITTLIVALMLPNIYKSTATVMIQNPQIPQNLVQSTVTSLADQRIQAITQEVSARSKILSLVDKFDLLPDKRESLSSEDLVEKIRERINVEPIHAEIQKETLNKPVALTIAFTLSYEDNDPRTAQLVANEITSYYLEKNLEAREQHTRTTTQFLDDQLRQAKVRLDELEGKMADYRGKHLEELPEFMALNMQKIEKLSSDISSLNMQVRSLEEQRVTVRTQLVGLDPYSGGTARVLSTQERTQQAQLERAALASRYSEKHPLVQAKKQEITLLESNGSDAAKEGQVRERLKQLEQELSDLKSRYSEKHPAVKSKARELEGVRRELEGVASKVPQSVAGEAHAATNPAYVALKADLEKADVSVTSMKAERARLEDQLKVVYEKLHSMPQVSKEYNEMMTEYQSAKTYLNELQEKLLSAQLALGMEEEKLGESFAVIEPAFLPEKHVKPNRLLILLIGLVLGLGLSIGCVSLVEFADTRIHDVEKVAQLAGVSVFSTIPTIVTKEDRIRATRKRFLLTAGTVGGLASTAALFHFYVMDLYVLNAKLIRLIELNLIM